MKGMGSTVPLHSTSSYPIPPEGGWDIVFVDVVLKGLL